MKSSLSSLIALGLLASSFVAYGQGQIKATSFNETNPSLGRILDTGGNGLPTSGYFAELWGGSSNDRNTFTMIRPKENISLVNGRTFDTGSSTLSGTTGTYFYEMRAWDNGGGAITTYSAATTRGVSSVASVTLTVSPAQPVEASNFATFQLAVVPEPTTVVFGLMGAGALLMRRRK